MKAKKSLGQNFLKSREAINSIIESGSITPEDTILEVGPGKGVLTTELLKLARKVIAVEKDSRLISELNEKFANEIKGGKLELIEGDILEYHPGLLATTVINDGKPVDGPPKLGGVSSLREGVVPYKIIANIPYYITGTFLQKFLEIDNQPSRMVLMLQKEVAMRIVAKDKKESILSMSVKAYGNPKYVMTVKAKYFSPAAKVDSAIILINDISKSFFDAVTEEDFFKFMKLSFAHKRKMILGNLSENYPREILEKAFDEMGIDKKIRAEDMTPETMKKLAIALH